MTSNSKKIARRKKRTSKHIQKASNTTNESGGKKKSQKIKDPSEATMYLSTWKSHPDKWKFNKNTQSWLLRHMYEPDKVNKGTFSLLMEYLVDLKGETRSRTVANARMRALRYKEYDKEGDGAKDGDDKKVTDDDKKEGVDDDDARWRQLSDHDKRKEYKRARKVLESLKDS